MKTLLFSLAIISTLIACNKNSDDLISSQNMFTGAFGGIFQRPGSDTAHVKLTFSPDGIYDGVNYDGGYPAICGGRYLINGSSITFTDTCNWTAGFDRTLILDGTYNYSRAGDSLRIWRTTSGITEEYNLDRMHR